MVFVFYRLVVLPCIDINQLTLATMANCNKTSVCIVLFLSLIKDMKVEHWLGKSSCGNKMIIVDNFSLWL